MRKEERPSVMVAAAVTLIRMTTSPTIAADEIFNRSSLSHFMDQILYDFL